MRLLVWLVLLNIALWGYFNMDKMTPKVEVVHKEVNPEKLKLLMDADFGSLERKTFVARPLTNCYKWGRFTSNNLEAAQEVMQRLGLESELIEETPKQDRRFWIYYPPLATPEKAKEKAEEIKRLGIDELYIVQDAQWRNSISFGLFNEEVLADNLLKNLKAKGVRYATKSVRNQGSATSSLLAKSVSAELAVELYNIRPEFIGTDVTSVACQ